MAPVPWVVALGAVGIGPLSVLAAIPQCMVKREGVPGRGCPVDVRLWGKELGLSRPYPVVCHLLDTAAVFGALWDVVLGEGIRRELAGALGVGVVEARAVLSFWAGLHDLGKITPPFQAQVPEAFSGVRAEAGYRFAAGAEQERAFRHEVATHWALTVLLAEVGYPEGRRTPAGQMLRGAVGHQVAQLLGGHHGFFGPVLKEREAWGGSAYQPGLGEEGWDVQRRTHFAELRRVTGAFVVPERGLSAHLAVIVAGLVVVADWLASQEAAIEAVMPPVGWAGGEGEVDVHWQAVCEAAPGLVAEAGLGRAQFAAERFQDMFSFAPNALQADLAAHLPGLAGAHGSGLVLVTAPTGEGKTEAALFAASVLGRAAGARGLYFALPTMATADAMYPRVKEFAERALAGERALALLHSMAWLSPAYVGDGQVTGVPGPEGQVSADAGTATEAGTWLRGSKRGLLAPLGAGTIDQALSGVLPLRYNVLRLFGLSDKVFVVDEAHAYGPWMHQLLVRLLEWLGAFGAPVVLLSATLTGRTASSLVEAYRRGAGFTVPVAVEPRYPGWLFASATGVVSEARATETGRSRTLDVAVRKVVWDTADVPESPVRARGRRAVLREELRRVVEDGGTALVCCTTVAEAQRTYGDLCAAFPELAARDGGLRILHSRFPANSRQVITAGCQATYGKLRTFGDAARPRPASVLVATQVVEQSLDFDFDLVVSDLAPLAQLLQRAGRGCRHERGPHGRPAWALPEDRPRLVVLDPFTSENAREAPRSWGRVYDTGLLVRTSLLLAAESGGIEVPGDVQRLVDAVYAEDFVDGLADAAYQEDLRRLDAERQAGEMAEEQLAAMVAVDAPADVNGDLHRLSRHAAGVTEELLTTRLGADSGRVLCLYEQDSGTLTLDEAGDVPVPEGGRHGLSRAELMQIMAHVAPVPGRWLRSGTPGHPAPRRWEKQPLLREVVLLRMRRDGSVWRCRHGDRTITISEVGLESSSD